MFAAWTPDASLGVVCGHRVVGRTLWYWAGLARRGRPFVHITDFEVVRRPDPFVIKGPALWAEHRCEAADEQWTVANEVVAVALDDASEALGATPGGARGVPTPWATDLEWYATADVEALPSGVTQPGVVHGTIELLDEPKIELIEVPARRWHRAIEPSATTGDLLPVAFPPARAHSGVRAAFAFPDGNQLDLCLTAAGWHERR